jgi:hypothetical protein
VIFRTTRYATVKTLEYQALAGLFHLCYQPTKRRNTMTQSNNKPIETFRSGEVCAYVWKKTGKNGTFYKATISVGVKNRETGEWKNYTEFSENELGDVQTVSRRAQDYMNALRVEEFSEDKEKGEAEATA